LSILFPIPPLFFNGAYIYEKESRICLLTSQKSSTAIYSIITTFVIPFNIIAIVYCKILYTISQSTRRVQPTISNIHTNTTPKINRKREIKLAKNMTSTRFFLFIICNFTVSFFFSYDVFSILFESSSEKYCFCIFMLKINQFLQCTFFIHDVKYNYLKQDYSEKRLIYGCKLIKIT